MSKRFLRKQGVALRYSVNTRTVERMIEDGRLPAPVYRGRIPLWDEALLDASDREAAKLPRPAKLASATV